MLAIDRLFQSPCMPFCGLGEIELAFANVAHLFQIHRNVRTAIRDGSHPAGSVRFIAYMGSLISMCTGIFLHRGFLRQRIIRLCLDVYHRRTGSFLTGSPEVSLQRQVPACLLRRGQIAYATHIGH